MPVKKSSNATDKHVGARIRMRRNMIGMSQEGLGDRLELSFQQVQKYEKGANRISAGRLQQISRILGVPITFFYEQQIEYPPGMKPGPTVLDLPPEICSPSIINDYLGSRDGLNLTAAFMSIQEPKTRRRIVDLVQQIAASAPVA